MALLSINVPVIAEVYIEVRAVKEQQLAIFTVTVLYKRLVGS